MIDVLRTQSNVHLLFGPPPLAARSHKMTTACGRRVVGQHSEVVAPAEVSCNSCRATTGYSSALATADRAVKSEDHRRRQAMLAAPEQIRSRRELAATIAAQATALAEGRVTGPEYAAVALLASNVETLRAWTPDDRH